MRLFTYIGDGGVVGGVDRLLGHLHQVRVSGTKGLEAGGKQKPIYSKHHTLHMGYHKARQTRIVCQSNGN